MSSSLNPLDSVPNIKSNFLSAENLFSDTVFLLLGNVATGVKSLQAVFSSSMFFMQKNGTFHKFPTVALTHLGL